MVTQATSLQMVVGSWRLLAKEGQVDRQAGGPHSTCLPIYLAS